MLDDPAGAVAERLAAAAQAGLHIALTGGSTPAAAYERAAALGADWSASNLWWGDERCVPPTHEDSNYGLARRTLLEGISGPQPTVHRMEGERGPEAGAAAYERELTGAFAGESARLDLVLLGLGSDAHCASLFPGAPALEERERAVVGVEQPGLAPWVSRITLTLPALAAAGELLFMVTGADKAPALARAFDGEPSPEAPASLARAHARAVTLVLDRAAAGG